jgi:hypothetical protein
MPSAYTTLQEIEMRTQKTPSGEPQNESAFSIMEFTDY